MNDKLKSSLLLLITATIWGTAFVAQSVGMEHVGPFTFTALRCLLGGMVLLPVIAIRDPDKRQVTAKERKTLIVGGICCGVMLFLAVNMQQFGIQHTSVGKAGFITAFYIVLVPVIGIFFRKKCPPLVWVGVAVALAGLWFLCMNGDDLTVNIGDVEVFLCALLFSGHILVVDHFSPLADGVKLSCIQFFVCSVLSTICMGLFEQPDVTAIAAAKWSLLYTGICSCGIAYTLQIIGQKGLNPTMASLIMSLESVISALAGWVILHERLSGREILGCVLVFAAVILVEVVTGRQEEKQTERR